MSPRWQCLVALTLARAAMGFQFQAVAAVALLLAPALGIDKTQLGWLIGLYLLPLSGLLASGRALVMAAAVAVTLVTGADYVVRAVVLRRTSDRAAMKRARRAART